MNSSTKRYLVIGAALAASLLSYCLLRNGILTTEDGWAYWEGSVSMLEDGRYSFLGGGNPVWWPPLFSAYLAIVQAVLGKTGFALIVAMCCLTFINTTVWLAFLHAYFEKCTAPKNEPSLWVGFSFIVLFMANCSIRLYAHFLLLGFIGLMLFLLIYIPTAPTRRYALLVCALAGAQAGALLTHNSALGLIPSVTLVLLLDASRALRQRLAGCGVYAVCGLAPFVVVRVLLQQGHSHPVGTRPRYGFIEYLYQSLSGLGEFFFTTASSRITGAASMLLGCGIVVLAAWAFVSAKGTDTYTRRLPVVVALVFYLFLLFVFNLTWIAAPLRYRHLYFLPLCLIPGICLPFSRKPLAVAVLLCPLILVAQGYRVVHWSVAGIVGPASFQHPANDVISVRYFLTGRKTELCPAGYVRVHPPTFEYMKRWSVEESASSQESVKAEPN